MNKFYIFSFLLLLHTSPSQAYFETGNTLVDKMRNYQLANQKSPEANYADARAYMSYVEGVSDALQLQKVTCHTQDVTLGQLSEIVAKYLSSNPERWNEPAIFLVSDALRRVYSCGKR